jgi:hypothetical protein
MWVPMHYPPTTTQKTVILFNGINVYSILLDTNFDTETENNTLHL